MADSPLRNDMPASKDKTAKRKIALGIACALWGLSIVLSFAIPISSPFIWLPDTVLLLGFFPLIWVCPYSLVWLAFGILTAFIGGFLLLLTNIPGSALPAQTIPIKKHLEDFHPCWSWMIIGVFVTICGSIRFLVNTLRFFLRKQRSPENAGLLPPENETPS